MAHIKLIFITLFILLTSACATFEEQVPEPFNIGEEVKVVPFGWIDYCIRNPQDLHCKNN